MIYVHIPFCRSFCTYCGFYSESVPCGMERDRFSRYVTQVCREAECRAVEIRNTLPSAAHPDFVDTLYLGGGTPSVLAADELARLAEGINNAVFDSSEHDYEEFTVEVNPEDVVEKGEAYVNMLMSLGVNRISMGVQSFDDNVLRWMNRRHDSRRALEAFSLLRKGGFGNISIDLISGFGGLSEECWRDTLQKAVDLRPEHISAYQMSVEEGSILARMASDGHYAEMPEEESRRQYDIMCQCLADAGYHHYEVSNFALPGREAVHNSAYWRRVPYAGLGAGAHSALSDADGCVKSRCWNTEAENGYVQETEYLTDEDKRVETIMLGLRMDRGVSPTLLDENVLSRLLDEGALEQSGGNVRIPEDRLFVSDGIIRELV